jgi:hypothetical protein
MTQYGSDAGTTAINQEKRSYDDAPNRGVQPDLRIGIPVVVVRAPRAGAIHPNGQRIHARPPDRLGAAISPQPLADPPRI